MDETLRSALDQIKAEQALKDRTAAYLQAQMSRRQRPVRPAMRLAAALAAIVVLAVSGAVSYGVYAAPAAFIDLDVNPSIELTLNRFGRVLSAQAYNDDGAALLEELPLRHHDYTQAAQELLSAMMEQGYLTDGLVSVTVQGGAEDELTAALQNSLSVLLAEHHATAALEVSAVSEEVKTQAHGHHMSPAKYLAVQALQEEDPAVTFEGCADDSLSELRERACHDEGHQGQASPEEESETQAHGGHGQHHGRR